MKLQDVRACIDCKLLIYVDGKPLCSALEGKFDLVTGQTPKLSAYAARASKAACGPEAKLFQAIPEQVAAEVAAIVRAHGPDVGTQVRDAVLRVIMLPGDAVIAAGNGLRRRRDAAKAGLARFGQRVAAARAAWHGIQDNTASPPILLTADPIAEAESIQQGGPMVVNLDAVADANVKALEGALAEMQPQPVAEPKPVQLAQPADPKQEQAAAGAMACLVTLLLIGWLAFGLLSHGHERGHRSVSQRECCVTKGKDARCVPCRSAAVEGATLARAKAFATQQACQLRVARRRGRWLEV